MPLSTTTRARTRPANPTLGTLAEVAAALGMRVALEPLLPAERQAVNTPCSKDVPPMRASLRDTSTSCGQAGVWLLLPRQLTWGCGSSTHRPST